MAATVATTSLPEPTLLGGVSTRRLLVLGGGVALLLGSLVLLAPVVADLPDALRRLQHGDMNWLGLALGLEALSFLGHAILFRAVGVDERGRIGLRASTEITLAGHAATRLLASAGAGGVALTAWAMRRSGMDRATVAARMTTFLVLLYSVYMLALLLGGAGLALGLLPGGGSVAITVVPAAFGGFVIGAALSLRFIRPGEGRLRATVAPIGVGVREALRLIRSRNAGLVGALMWWGFDIAVLWACFAAFGDTPPVGVLVVAYFVGTLANTLPLPGGVGGVEGGMIGALAAFGVDPALALVAVLAYRGFAFWLPIVPGAIAFVSLRRTVAQWELEDALAAVPALDALPAGAAPHALVAGAAPHALAAGAAPHALAAPVASEPWKASEGSSTTRNSSAGSRRWPNRCRPLSRSPGLTTPSSSLST